MSAYVVSRRHIGALIRAAIRGPIGAAGSPDRAWYPAYWIRDPEALGELLLTAVVESVRYRYADLGIGDLPGPRPAYWLEPVDWPAVEASAPDLEAVAILKAIDGYEYQACELPTWEGSEAWRFCLALRDAVTRYLPGYDAAAWEIAEAVPA